MLSFLKFPLVFVIALFAYSAAVASAKTVQVVDLLNVDVSYLTNYEPYREGVYGYMHSIQNPNMHPTTISMIYLTGTDGGKVTDAIQTALSDYSELVAFLGPYSDDSLASALNYTTYYVFFGPLTGGLTYRGTFNRNILFTRINPQGELLVLLRYALIQLRAKKIGFMYTTGVSCGENLYSAAQAMIDQVGISDTIFVVYNEKDSSSVNQDSINSILNSGAQAVLIQGFPGTHLSDAVTALIDTGKYAGNVLTSSYQHIMVQNIVGQLSRTTDIPSVFATTPGSAMPTSSSTMQSFYSDMESYLKSIATSYNSPTVVETNYAIGSMMLQGYITGAALLFSMRIASVSGSAKDYTSNLFPTFNSFFVHQITLGYYQDDVNRTGTYAGVLPACNEGGQAVSLFGFTDGNATGGLVQTVSNSVPFCGLQGTIPYISNAVILSYSSNDVLQAAYSEAVSANLSGGGSSYPYAAAEVASYWTAVSYSNSSDYVPQSGDVIIGPYDPSETTDATESLIWSPVFPEVQIDTYDNNTYHITPVFSQSVLSLYGALTSVSNLPISKDYREVVTGVVRASNPTQVYFLQEAIVTLSTTFSFLAYVETCSSSDDITSKMWTSGTNILVGMQPSEAQSVVSFLASNGNAIAFFPYRSMSLAYSDLVSALKQNSGVSARVWFDSNFQFQSGGQTPLEGEFSMALSILQNSPTFFRGGRSSGSYLPLYPFGGVTASAKNGLGDSVRLYFLPKKSTGQIFSRSLSRGRNYGATLNSIYSFQSSTAIFSSRPDPAVLPQISADTITSPGMPSEGVVAEKIKALNAAAAKRREATVGIFFFAAVAIILFLIAFCALAWLLWSAAVHAPKDPRKPITIAHINVDYDIALWSELPGVMSPMLSNQHKIIQRLAKKHKCYEVRSDGASTVIASKTPFSAVRLAMDLQAALEHSLWTSPTVDIWYKYVEKKRQQMNQEADEPELPSDDVDVLWRGIRVRIAVDTGMCGVRTHQMLFRYSYFGPPVDLTYLAQSIAHGGQVIVSGNTWKSLSSEEIAILNHVYLGAYQFCNGLPPMSFFSVSTVAGTLFPPLRPLPETLQNFAPRKEAVPHLSERYAKELKWVFEPGPDDAKEEYLLMFAERWGVNPPERGNMSSDEYFNRLIDLIAFKMAGSELWESDEDEEEVPQEDMQSVVEKSVSRGLGTERSLSVFQDRRKSVTADRRKSMMSERGRSIVSERARSITSSRKKSFAG